MVDRRRLTAATNTGRGIGARGVEGGHVLVLGALAVLAAAAVLFLLA